MSSFTHHTLWYFTANSLLAVFLKDNTASWFWPVWDSEQGDMAVSSWCCGRRCEDTAVQCLTGRQSQVSVINGQFRHLNSVPELAVVVTVGEPVSKQIFCFVCMIIVYTTLKTIPFLCVCERKTPSTFHTHGRKLHCTYWNCSVSLCAVRTVSLCAVRTVSLCAVRTVSHCAVRTVSLCSEQVLGIKIKLYIILHV